jgi:hypothetical protein
VEAKPTRRRRGGQIKPGALTVQQDPAFKAYEPGHSQLTIENARAGVREFLTTLGLTITPTALSELITKTRQQHRNDDFATDAALEHYAAEPPSTHNTRARLVAEIFKRNRSPLMCKFAPIAKGRKTKLISPGILKAIFDRLPRRELRLLIDLQNHSPERIDVLATTPLTSWERVSPDYYAIHYDPAACKVAYDHIGLVPATLGDEILAYAKQLGRTCPFPNYETLWREIRDFALKTFGLRLTSTYLRKRFLSIAGKTEMPVNDWDFLAGHKQTLGNHAEAYQLEDYSGLIQEYTTYLLPYLSITEPKDPLEAKQLIRASPQLEQLQKENQELKERILKLTCLLTQHLDICKP